MLASGIRLVLASLLMPLALVAQSDGLSLMGEGVAEVAASRVEIRGTYEARAEVPGDAFVKFAQAAKRVSAKMKELEVPGLKIATLGMQVGVGFAGAEEGGMNNVVIMGMGGGEKTLDPEVVIRERFVATIPLAELNAQERQDAITSVVEACRELGIKHPGGQANNDMVFFAAMTNRETPGTDNFELAGAVSFHAADPQALYRAAVKGALADARSRAEIQAELIGGQLGAVKELKTLEGGHVGASKSMMIRHRMKMQVRYAIN
jgi:uncharacterized protein DUF541